MKINKIAILIIFLLGLVGILVWNNLPSDSSPQEKGTKENIYQNQNYGFSLVLPKEAEVLNIENMEDMEGELLMVKGENFQTQIYIMSFDEDIILTAERIKKDIPDLKIKDEKEIKIGETLGVEFLDEEQGTKEIWFVKEGFIYQISSFLKDQKALVEIISQWQWR